MHRMIIITFKGSHIAEDNRTYDIPDDSTDWYYSERICENWFYYEIHDGMMVSFLPHIFQFPA